MKRAIATCDCACSSRFPNPEDFLEVAVRFDPEAEGEVCAICGNYPLYIRLNEKGERVYDLSTSCA